MKRLIAAVLVGLLVAFAGCSEPPPDQGVIIAKNYDDPDSWTTGGNYVPGRCAYNYSTKTQTCYPGYFTPIIHHEDGPHWRLQIEYDGKSAWVDAPGEQFWNDAPIGRCYSHKEKRLLEIGCEPSGKPEGK